jgi:hypothetical protein
VCNNTHDEVPYLLGFTTKWTSFSLSQSLQVTGVGIAALAVGCTLLTTLNLETLNITDRVGEGIQKIL